MDWVNIFSTGHRILAVENAESWADKVVNAGSVFIGHFTPESAGDYASGTNHTLPTGGFARVYGGVSTDSFIKKITFQHITPQGLQRLGNTVVQMAEAEGLEAHAEAVRVRLRAQETMRLMPESIVGHLLRGNVRQLKPYSSARDEAPPTGGTARIFLDANENSLGSPLKTAYHRYPEPRPAALLEALARLKSVSAEQIFVGNGSDEAIDLLIRAFCVPGRDHIIIVPPTYGMYAVQADIHGVAIRRVPLNADFSLDTERIRQSTDARSKILFLCSPNNPTGNVLERSEVEHILQTFPGIVVVDEAYTDFASSASWVSELQHYPRLVILQTLSKAWGLAGLRIGMALAHPDVIAVFNKIKYPYNINLATAALAVQALDQVAAVQAAIGVLNEERQRLSTALSSLKVVVKVFPSEANFLLVQVTDADAVYQYLVDHGIIVRNRSRELHCAGCLRITIGTPEENSRLTDLLANFL